MKITICMSRNWGEPEIFAGVLPFEATPAQQAEIHQRMVGDVTGEFNCMFFKVVDTDDVAFEGPVVLPKMWPGEPPTG